MSKFCTNCGKPLEEGATCSCQANTQAYNPAPQQTFNPNYQAPQQPMNQGAAPAQNPYFSSEGTTNVNVDIKKFFDFCLNMLKFSVEFIKRPIKLAKMVAAREDFKAGIFFMAAQAIIIGLFMMSLYKACKDESKSFLAQIAGVLGKAYGVKSLSDIPYFAVFIKTFVFEAVFSLILVGVIFALGKFIFRGKGNVTSILGVVGVSAIPFTMAGIINVVVVLFSPALAGYIFLISIIMGLAVAIAGINETLKIEENLNLYFLTIAFVIYYFIVLSIICIAIDANIFMISSKFLGF